MKNFINLLIDGHQHFWQIARGDYGRMSEKVADIRHDILPADLEPHLQRPGINGTVLVQAAGTVAETEFMIRLSQQATFIKDVFGGIDFDADAAAIAADPMPQDWGILYGPMQDPFNTRKDGEWWTEMEQVSIWNEVIRRRLAVPPDIPTLPEATLCNLPYTRRSTGKLVLGPKVSKWMLSGAMPLFSSPDCIAVRNRAGPQIR